MDIAVTAIAGGLPFRRNQRRQRRGQTAEREARGFFMGEAVESTTAFFVGRVH